jgi:hypothetical protein
MASYKISPAGSIYATGAGQHAFNLDSKDADTFVLDPSAFLIAAGAGGNGAVLANTKPWQATINGSIISTTASGLVLNSGNSGTSKISIGTEGSISGDIIGVSLNSAANISNAGTIKGYVGVSIENAGAHVIKNTGTIYAIDAAIIDYDGLSNETVTNSGIIQGAVMLGGGNDSFANSGIATRGGNGAAKVDLGGGNDTFTNSGGIGADVHAGDGNDILTNSGSINGSKVDLGIGNDKFTNTGQIFSFVYGGEGADSVTNSGFGYIDADVDLGGDKDVFVNSGSVNGKIELGGGDDLLTNSGTLSGSVVAGEGNDKIINSKTIEGIVRLGEGDNFFTNSGTADGVVGGSGKDIVSNTGAIFGADLGAGDDIYNGGARHDSVIDGAGSDIIKLGGSSDYYLATRTGGGTDGTDTVDGGSGEDTYDASSALGTVSINLDTVSHDMSPFDVAGFVAANTANGTDADIGFTDKLKNFENAHGGEGNDFIYGSAGVNFLGGNDGFDVLYGFAGNDTLYGGEGGDLLYGGTGKDQLSGGKDNDTFRFASTADTGVTSASRDEIRDFENGLDLIDLSHIDANTATKGVNDAFTYIGTNVAFTKTTGELRAYWTANGQIIEGDVNGDGRADFSIELTDADHSIALDTSDFLL